MSRLNWGEWRERWGCLTTILKSCKPLMTLILQRKQESLGKHPRVGVGMEVDISTWLEGILH